MVESFLGLTQKQVSVVFLFAISIKQHLRFPSESTVHMASSSKHCPISFYLSIQMQPPDSGSSPTCRFLSNENCDGVSTFPTHTRYVPWGKAYLKHVLSHVNIQTWTVTKHLDTTTYNLTELVFTRVHLKVRFRGCTAATPRHPGCIATIAGSPAK